MNKYALYKFSYLIYNQEINSFLIIIILFTLLKYYISKKSIKKSI